MQFDAPPQREEAPSLERSSPYPYCVWGIGFQTNPASIAPFVPPSRGRGEPRRDAPAGSNSWALGRQVKWPLCPGKALPDRAQVGSVWRRTQALLPCRFVRNPHQSWVVGKPPSPSALGLRRDRLSDKSPLRMCQPSRIWSLGATRSRVSCSASVGWQTWSPMWKAGACRGPTLSADKKNPSRHSFAKTKPGFHSVPIFADS